MLKGKTLIVHDIHTVPPSLRTLPKPENKFGFNYSIAKRTAENSSMARDSIKAHAPQPPIKTHLAI